MQIIDEMEVKSRREFGERSESGFHKVNDIKYCKVCGKEQKESKLTEAGTGMCTSCGDLDFISGDFASALGGYLRLYNEGKLRKYYESVYRKESSVRVNTKRMIISLLLRDGFFTWSDKKTESVVYKIIRVNEGE